MKLDESWENKQLRNMGIYVDNMHIKILKILNMETEIPKLAVSLLNSNNFKLTWSIVLDKLEISQRSYYNEPF